ncbi:MAG: hypothetical protein K2J83_00465, partial [Clostridia bacterium]|nr:hypothetical protein [Clostridia bacterium]
CLTQGETEYTFNKDGVNVTFTVVTDINPQAHTLKKHNASEADCGLGKDGNIEYYSCECGKLFHDAEGQEEIDSVSDTVIPAEHTLSAVAANANSEVVKYPNDTSATFRNMAHYECGDCGKLFKDENGENEVTSVFALTRCGMLLSYGDNLVDATDVAAAKNGNLYFMTFIAETNGVYQITFNDGVTINTVQYIITGAKTPSTPNAYTSGAWNSESTVFNRFTMSDTTQPLTNSVTVNMVAGEWVFIVVDSVKYSVNIATQPVLVEGANKIDITEAYSVEFNDKYDFVPNETKAYSMTVPAGMVVLMNGQEFLDGDTASANFEGVAGEKIEFAFGYTQSGAVTVTIGEAVDLPKITPDEPLSAFRIEGHAVSVLEVGDIEEGTYTITLTVPSGLMRSFVYFGKNVSENYEDYFLSNGNPVSGNPAEVSFQFPNATVLNGAPYTATLKTVTWTVTLDLKAGDKLVFITSSTGGDVNVSMVAA